MAVLQMCSTCSSSLLSQRIVAAPPLLAKSSAHVHLAKSLNLSFGVHSTSELRKQHWKRGKVIKAGDGGTQKLEALLFDCDGVLVDTEKDGHRVSFNEAFAERGLNVIWDVDLYGKLLKIGGGKERMTAYFNERGWPDIAPESESERAQFVASLHKRKTELFMNLIERNLLPLRPGVSRIINEALIKGVKVAICSTSNEKAVSAIVQGLLDPSQASSLSIFAGDVVPQKKPDPAIYLLAASTLGIPTSRCVVVEDSAIGLAAAKAAGMKCIITKSGYTAEEDFSSADAVFDTIGDPPDENFNLEFCQKLIEC
eukprot:TRINITY_DN28381_c0_g4_i2.p1 TRINITY_DN28381_c0_g4~~TRINITY_DN28381_c0_g4_i2.p1  ORF type:complete len:312 (-),score=66.30 TRINITY_DN28381_c0_g4_i2:325-1260(-)